MTGDDERPAVGRRRFLTVSGAVLGGIATGTTVVAAERTHRFIVDTQGSGSARRLEQAGLEVVHDLNEVNLAVVEGAESDVEAVTSSYEVDVEVTLDAPDVPDELADQEGFFDLPADQNDEDLYDLMWDKQAQNVKEAHETTTGAGTRVAVIDDGIYAGHPDLDINESLSRNFSGDDNGTGALFDDHGTHVAGTIAASANGEGVLGTAPDAELVDLRVFSGSTATFGNVVAAVAYSAAIDADVANLSLGAYPIPRQAIGQFYGKVLNRVMTYANKEGTLLVIAAGNDGADLRKDKNFISLPNEGAQGLSVAATGPEGFLFGDDGFEDPPESPALYTNYGTNDIVLGAPGGDIDPSLVGEVPIPALLGDWVLSTTFDTPDNEEPADQDGDGLVDDGPSSKTPLYGYKLGTSMAAPQVAGAAALVKANNPSYNANQVESALRTAAEVPDGYDKAYYGAGFVDPVGALAGDNDNSGNGNGKDNGN